MDTYIDRLAALPISTFNRQEQFAYWINLYNALTIQVVATHYPVGSIREIDLKDGSSSDGPWEPKILEIEGEKISLNDIEHRILRPIWQDPRIHYAVNCSIGCPNIRRDAYVGETVNRVLESAARDFVNNSRAVSFDDGDLIVSEQLYLVPTGFWGLRRRHPCAFTPLCRANPKAKLAQGESIAVTATTGTQRDRSRPTALTATSG